MPEKSVWITYEDVEENYSVSVRSRNIHGFLVDHNDIDVVKLVVCHQDGDDVVWVGDKANSLEVASILKIAMIFVIESAEIDGATYVDLTPMQDGHPTYTDLIEAASKISHDQWAHWVHYMLDNMTNENIKHWRELMYVKYNDLTEKQKESDREWATKYIRLMTGKL